MFLPTIYTFLLTLAKNTEIITVIPKIKEEEKKTELEAPLAHSLTHSLAILPFSSLPCYCLVPRSADYALAMLILFMSISLFQLTTVAVVARTQRKIMCYADRTAHAHCDQLYTSSVK